MLSQIAYAHNGFGLVSAIAPKTPDREALIEKSTDPSTITLKYEDGRTEERHIDDYFKPSCADEYTSEQLDQRLVKHAVLDELRYVLQQCLGDNDRRPRAQNP